MLTRQSNSSTKGKTHMLQALRIRLSAPHRDHPLVVYVFSQDKAFQNKGTYYTIIAAFFHYFSLIFSFSIQQYRERLISCQWYYARCWGFVIALIFLERCLTFVHSTWYSPGRVWRERMWVIISSWRNYVHWYPLLDGYYTGQDMFDQFTHKRASIDNPSWWGWFFRLL